MIGVTVPKTAFKAYKVEEAVSFAIELSTAKGDSSKGLIKILESLEWDIVSLVEITKTALTLDCGYASLHLLQDIDGVTKSPRVPELVYPCAYTIQTSEFFNYVKLVRTVEEHVVLTEDHISSNVTSDLSNSIRIDITPLASVDRMNIVRSVFSAKMLLNTAKELAVVVPTVQVEIGNDLPENNASDRTRIHGSEQMTRRNHLTMYYTCLTRRHAPCRSLHAPERMTGDHHVHVLYLTRFRVALAGTAACRGAFYAG
jgi:hypothetical protein